MITTIMFGVMVTLIVTFFFIWGFNLYMTWEEERCIKVGDLFEIFFLPVIIAYGVYYLIIDPIMDSKKFRDMMDYVLIEEKIK